MVLLNKTSPAEAIRFMTEESKKWILLDNELEQTLYFTATDTVDFFMVPLTFKRLECQ